MATSDTMMNVMEQSTHDTHTHYEILVIQKTEDYSKVKQCLTKHGAEIVAEKPLEKVKLAYPIQHETMAFMGTVEFMSAPEVIAAIQGEIKLDENVIRATVSKVSKKVERRPQEKTASAPSATRRFFGRFRKAPEPAALTNEALEKKIEEISQ